MSQLSAADARRYLAFITILFLIWGVMATAFGAISPNLQREFALDDARLSWAPAVLATGSALGALWGGTLGGALKLRRVILGCLTLGAGGLALMAAAPSWALYLLGVFLMTLLVTASVTLCNALLTRLGPPERRTAVFGRAQASYMFGAVVGPLAAAALLWGEAGGNPQEAGGWRLVYGACLLALGALLVWGWLRLASLSQAGVRLEAKGGFSAYGHVLRDPRLRWVLLAAALGGGILESAHAAFATLHAAKGIGLGDDAGRMAYTAFTLGMFLSRLGISMSGGKARPEDLLAAAGGLAAVSALALTAAQGQALATGANFGLGLAAGASFPLIMLLGSGWRPDLVDAMTGAVILASSASYQIASLSLGALGDAYGLRAAYGLVAAGGGLWLLVCLRLRALSLRREAA